MSGPENGQARRELSALMSAVFGSQQGKAALRELERFCGTRSGGFNAASERQTCYNLGRQSVALWIRQLTSDGDGK